CARDCVDVAGGHGLAVETAGCGRDNPDAVVVAIGEDQVASAVYRDAPRLVELRVDRRSAVSGEACSAGAGHGVDLRGVHGHAVERARRTGQHPYPVDEQVSFDDVLVAVDG